MKVLRYASAVVALIVAIGGGLWAFDTVYVRYAMFQSHEIRHLEKDLIVNQDGIWQYEDRLKKHPEDEVSQDRLRKLKSQREQLEKQLEHEREGGKQ